VFSHSLDPKRASVGVCLRARRRLAECNQIAIPVSQFVWTNVHAAHFPVGQSHFVDLLFFDVDAIQDWHFFFGSITAMVGLDGDLDSSSVAYTGTDPFVVRNTDSLRFK
jgi:hypothetical protein